MLALLNPRVWIALAVAAVLSFAGLFLYRAGGAAVQVTWDAEKLAQADAVRAAEQELRATESRRQSNVIEAQNAQTQRNRTLQADADRTRSERDGLHNTLAALGRSLPIATADAGSHNACAARELFDALGAGIERLAATGADIARAADGHSSDTLTLQQAWPK